MRYKAIAAALAAAFNARNGNDGYREVSQKRLQHRRSPHDRHAGPRPHHDARRVVYAGRQGNTTVRIHESVLVLIEFGGGLCAPAHDDGYLIHHRHEG
jgi:hypothetical protein